VDLAGNHGITLTTVASVAALRNITGICLSGAQAAVLMCLESYFESQERPQVRHACVRELS
jgi:hypothetical protein